MELAAGQGKRGIPGSVLKIIAVVSMLIDHTAAALLRRILERLPRWSPVTMENVDAYYTLYLAMRGIGRMAFPIYCFLLVEGFTYTKSRAKYALRLFVFALVSEVPFDLAFNRSFFDMSYNNVFFTLLIGLLVMIAVDRIREKLPFDLHSGGRAIAVSAGRTAAAAAVLLTGCALAEYVLCTDYGACGVLAIFALYVLKEQRMAGFVLAVAVLALLSDLSELAALFMLIPLYFYNGKRGMQMKYFFYAFYPVHLLILSLICWGLGLGI